MDKNKSYWLLTWNPDKWKWEDYEEYVEDTKSGKPREFSWICSSKKPRIGDDVFLIKLGEKEPKGIIAHGKVINPSYKESQSDNARYIDAEFDDMKDFETEPILRIEMLKQTFPDQTWSPQSSGIQIKCDVNKLQKMWTELQENKTDTTMDKYINLLKNNHNLILTGAPGTGKTYLAKQIAEAMGCTENEIGFVQFHPSYDYTDFVEGLRPLQDESGAVGFERKDGVFKEFCEKALRNQNGNQEIFNFDNAYNLFVNDIIKNDNSIEIETPVREEKFNVSVNRNNGNLVVIPQTKAATSMSISKNMLQKYMESGKIANWKPCITAVASYVELNYGEMIFGKAPEKISNFVFIIDEINRGEISKIFGELFFSIDPGYRGVSGKVKTQYQNLIKENDEFYDGFYVPENVYIIGTMNDIDRSVESMDFAFRRRFAFVEVKASENTGMLNGMEWKDEAIERMNSLNDEIEKIDGLSSAYHIGASYFLKLENYNGDFEQLWKYHLEGLLREYLRGTQDVDKMLTRR